MTAWPGCEELFGGPPATGLPGSAAWAGAEAPGRLNLVGEHTDYNGGFVLPIATPQRTRVELRRRGDGRVRAWSAGDSAAQTADPDRTAGAPRDAIVEYRIGEESAGRGWLDYVQGVTWCLAAAGQACRGFDARITSTVPAGAGLASSAALTVALLRALRAAGLVAAGEMELARLAQRVETGFVGVPVGIMDPMAACFASTGEALLIDTRSLATDAVPLPAGVAIAAIDSGLRHRHSGGAYARRRAECAEAAALLGVAQLRDAAHPELDRLPPPLARRARHVVRENERVLAAVEAMRRGDAPRLGAILDEAHRSLAEDFEVSTPEIDLLARLARADPAALGARLTGGGFGGAVLVLVRCGGGGGRGGGAADDLDGGSAAWRIAAAYGRATGRTPAVLVPPAGEAPVGAERAQGGGR